MPKPGLTQRLKSALKPLAVRAARPGLVAVHERFDTLERLLAVREGERLKYDSELAYWRYLVKNGGSQKDFGDHFEVVFGNWQRNRLRKRSEFLGLGSENEPGGIDDWCATRSALEIGAGPYPALGAARKGWKRCVAVDPIARGYVEEGLVPECCGHIVYIEAKGEGIPLPSGCADLIINENCLDHVTDPGAVVREMVRLLKPGGHLWLFVDLSNHVDHMHPHAMNEVKVRRLLEEVGGFVTVREEVSAHKAHPQAYGGFRSLLQRPSPVEICPAGPVPTGSIHVRGWPKDDASSRGKVPVPSPESGSAARSALNGSAAEH
jgi:SAM-dependent methyltransferase